MVVSCCTGDQTGKWRSLAHPDDQAGKWRSLAHRPRQRIKSAIERHEKSLQTSRGGVFFSVPCLTWLIRRLARCWLKQDERRVDKHGDDGADDEGPPERLLHNYVRLQAYVLTAVTGLGYLALTWSTVVLLGGFVTSLGKEDFWCLTVISTIQAAKIFDTLQDDLVIYLWKSFLRMIKRWDRVSISIRSNVRREILAPTRQSPMSIVKFFYSILMTPIIVVPQIVVVLYLIAPFVGIIISAWRLSLRDYDTSNSGDNSKANLTPALDIYYALVLLQGAFYLLWYFNNLVDCEIVRSVCRRCKLDTKNWGRDLVSDYLSDARRTCTKEPASLGDRDLITYAVGLLESESPKEYMSGARLLATFINQGKDVRLLLLLSRPKIQKLIDTLGWRGIPVPGAKSQEIRLLVAKIVADVAGNIHLGQFPGAAQCIACLFEEDEDENLPVVVTSRNRTTAAAEGRNNRSQEEGGEQEEDACNNELILQEGLTILERLASNHHNCRDICNSPGLLSVITAPIYSDTLTTDIQVSACAEVAYTSFKVLHRLIRTPGWTGRRLRREVSSSNRAVSNLEKILDPGTGASQKLQMGAMEIHTELALDLSINVANETKENLIRRQLHVFLNLAADEVEEPLKIVAGRTLALLSNTNSMYIIRERHDNADRLTEIMLDGNTNTVHKITAAEILVNLCTHSHSMLPEEYVKGTLLPNVLARILSSNVEPQPQQSEPSRRNICNCFTGICGIASQGDDVESQPPNHNSQNQQPAQENEEQILTNKLLEASLSLTLLIYDKMICADGFDAVFQENAPADQLVARLKSIVEENCIDCSLYDAATCVSLRIVKLCGQIAISMMQRQGDQYIAHFRDQEFVESLSKASGIMSNLESCMLVTGTNNCRMRKNNARPLLFHLEVKVRELAR